MENTNPQLVTGAQIQFMRDTYPVPTDFNWFNNRTMWDQTNRWELLGPDSPQFESVAPLRHCGYRPPQALPQNRSIPQHVQIWPPPGEITSPLQLVFEYLSIAAVAVLGNDADAATFAQYFTNDGNTCLLDKNAVIMGIKWIFLGRLRALAATSRCKTAG